MRRSRTVIFICAAAATLLSTLTFLIYLKWLFTNPDKPRISDYLEHPVSGVTLELSTLGAGERAVVTHTTQYQWVRTMTYTFEGAATGSFAVVDREARLSRGYGFMPGKLLAAHAGAISQAQLEGLDIMLRCLRAETETEPYYQSETFHFEYFRGGEKIGEERFVTNLGFYWSKPDYEDLPESVRLRVSRAEWRRAVSFTELWRALPVTEDDNAS
jgi:hypothetical protein